MSTPPYNPLTDYNFAEKAAAAAGGGVAPNEVVMARDPLTTDIYPIGQLWYSTSSSHLFVLTAVSAGSATWSQLATGSLATPVTVPNGGTGDTSLTAHGVMIGAGTSAVAVTSAGTAGQALVSGGASADPAFATLGVAGGGTGATTLTAHGVLVGEGTSAVAALTAGTNGQVLVGSTGADPVFATLTSSDSSITFTTGAGTLSLQAASSGVFPVDTNSNTTYTLALTDASKFLVWTAGSTATITVPLNATIAFPVNTEIDFFQQGAGQVVFAAAGGVTIQSANSNLKIAVQFGGATLKKLATDTWALVGNLTA